MGWDWRDARGGACAWSLSRLRRLEALLLLSLRELLASPPELRFSLLPVPQMFLDLLLLLPAPAPPLLRLRFRRMALCLCFRTRPKCVSSSCPKLSSEGALSLPKLSGSLEETVALPCSSSITSSVSMPK